MSIDPKLILSNFPSISVILIMLIIERRRFCWLHLLVDCLRFLPYLRAVGVGLMLAPSGESAFVALGAERLSTRFLYMSSTIIIQR
jgi:Kef-type K+ transport system membrane component KefB